MSENQWAAVDQYLCEKLLPADPSLDQAIQASIAAGLPPINVAPNQGKLLHLLVKISGAKKILEVGTLGGYSSIWLASALGPGGRLTTLELESKYAEVALANIGRAGMAERVDLRLGPAMETLPGLVDQAPFDLIFIDADKTSTADYFQWAVRFSRKGTIIIVDNVVRNGAIIDKHSEDPGVQGIRRFNDMVSSDPRVTLTAIQTVGSKGYDGFAIALVIADSGA